MNRFFVFLLFFFSLTTWQCGNNGYSFRGISIPADVRTYYVGQFKNNALNAPPTIATDFSEALKEKIRRESRLILNETSPDVEFQGTIVDFRVTAEAPQPGATSAINRLTIITAVQYSSNKDETAGFKKNFSFFFDFPASVDLASVQTDAIEAIFTQLTEDIFNAAFTNW
ncbi:MAG: hypothetical protein DA408_05720 [Bacteroidetes bacterium]|nr:MAG: hypothetical protein C7N36_20445 [Bacteroidota bacterium]PTM13632.1 MAG: hypothetical protein DA408_05720 [Bacteroidota bacterium]